MTLPFPYPLYGFIYDSNHTLVAEASVSVSDISSKNTSTDSEGKYVLDIQDITSIGNTLSISASYLGEKYDLDWTVDVISPGKRLDITLQEARTVGSILLNTSRGYNNSLYVFNSDSNFGWLKTSEYD